MSKLASINVKFSMGARLLALRKQLRLTQVEFAERLGLAPRAYANYERGERELPTDGIRRLYQEFNVDPLWVLEGDPKKITFASERLLDLKLLNDIGAVFSRELEDANATMAPSALINAVGIAYTVCVNDGQLDTEKAASIIEMRA